jgi:predicted PurR-regulated permease PerM
METPGSPEPANPPLAQSRAILRDLLLVAAVGAGMWMVHRLGRIVIVLILAMFFAYIIAPLVDLAQHPMHFKGRSRRLPRGAAIALVYLLLAAAFGTSGAVLWPGTARQLDTAIVNVPTYTEAFHTWEHGWTRYYEKLRIPIELRHSIDESVLGAGDTTAAYARGSLMTMIGLLSDIPFLVLVPVLAFLLLKDAAGFRRTVLTSMPHRIQLRAHRLLADLDATLQAYIRAQLIACILVGAMCGIGFALLGSPYAILLGVLAAALEFIPLIGPLIVGVVAVIAAAVHDPMAAVWTAVFLMLLRLVEDYVIYPRLIGRNIHLNSLVVILAVLAGVELGGIAGIFIAVPVVALVTVIGRHCRDWWGQDAENLRHSPSEVVCDLPSDGRS